MKRAFFVLQLLIATLYTVSAQSINIIDSMGYKQGLWIEYRVDPIGLDQNGILAYSPDSNIVYHADIPIYGRKCSKSGILRQIGNYNNSLRDGIWTLYRSDGTLFRRVNYKNGIITGKITSYYQNGSLIAEREIQHNQKLFLINYFNEDGSFYRQDTTTVQKEMINYSEF